MHSVCNMIKFLVALIKDNKTPHMLFLGHNVIILLSIIACNLYFTILHRLYIYTCMFFPRADSCFCWHGSLATTSTVFSQSQGRTKFTEFNVTIFGKNNLSSHINLVWRQWRGCRFYRATHLRTQQWVDFEIRDIYCFCCTKFLPTEHASSRSTVTRRETVV